MEQFAQYGHAIVALAAMAAFGLLLGPISGMRKRAHGLTPGAEPKADYADPCYRWHRAQQNTAEIIGPFAAVVLAAILAGANPFWVNLLASLFFVSRVLLTFVHVKGIGKPDVSLRSFTYIAGWLMCLILAILAITAVFWG
jgi:uncharacterized MAPEG superfamily protein